MRTTRRARPAFLLSCAFSAIVALHAAAARADDDEGRGERSRDGAGSGRLVVTRSVYPGTGRSPYPVPVIIPGKTALPGGGTAVADGTYPNVFNNNKLDGSFGVTSPIYLDVLSASGHREKTLSIDVARAVTSFSSKSELAINRSQNGRALTFMAYVAPVSTLDVSNSNTPNHVDPTNPVALTYPRAVVQVDRDGKVRVTPVNGYSGNNGRAAVLAGNGLYYMAGNAGNGGTPQPTQIIDDTGVLMIAPGAGGEPVQVGTFSISQVIDPATKLPYAPDKLGKDSNFRGLTVFDNTLYVTKGSGSNGIDTVYQVGSAGTLPTQAVSDNPGQGGNPTNMSILPGFPTQLAKSQPGATGYYPFGLWFADANTLYVADEGDGTAADATVSTHAGLQKWTRSNGIWQLAYVLQDGLGLGQSYSVSGLPASLNPSTDGLRNIAGRHNGDGTVTIYAVTSTISASGDQGADPNRLVRITDRLSYRTAAQAAGERFSTVQTARYGEVLRGVAVISGEGDDWFSGEDD